MTGVLYGAQGAQTVDHPERGIARYVADLAAGIGEVEPGLIEAIVYDPALPLTSPFERLREVAPLVSVDDPLVGRARLFHVASPFELGRAGETLLPSSARSGRTRRVATLYDLIPLVYPADYLPSGFERVLYRRSLELVRSCDAVVAISEATAADATRLLGIPARRLCVIGAGANDGFAAPVSADEPWSLLADSLPLVRRGFVFLPTGMDARKNWQTALRAFAALDRDLRRDHQLVLTCRVDAEQRARVAHLATELGITDDLVVTGVVDDATLVALYQAAELVVYPSRYEGFGLPPLEARLCGAPVICGDNSSLREVITDPHARFDADDVGALAAMTVRGLVDAAFRQRLLQVDVQAHTWRAAARRTVATYHEQLDRRERAF